LRCQDHFVPQIVDHTRPSLCACAGKLKRQLLAPRSSADVKQDTGLWLPAELLAEQLDFFCLIFIEQAIIEGNPYMPLALRDSPLQGLGVLDCSPNFPYHIEECLPLNLTTGNQSNRFWHRLFSYNCTSTPRSSSMVRTTTTPSSAMFLVA